MSEENWDVAKLERILKKTQLSLENQRNFITYWTNEKEKVPVRFYEKIVDCQFLIYIFLGSRICCKEIEMEQHFKHALLAGRHENRFTECS